MCFKYCDAPRVVKPLTEPAFFLSFLLLFPIPCRSLLSACVRVMGIELPVVSFLCVALLVVAIPSYYRRMSIANVSIMVWLVVAGLIHAVNALIWSGNTSIVAVSWCDLATRLILGMNVAIPASLLCLSRQLEVLPSDRQVPLDLASARRRTILELACAVIFPGVYIALSTIVQDSRFTIIENYGCQSSFFPSSLTIILIWLPPLIICIIGFIYLAFTLIHVSHHRHDLSEYLEPRTQVPAYHFLRIFAVCFVQLFLLFLLLVMSMANMAVTGLQPLSFISRIHNRFTRINAQDLSSITPSAMSVTMFAWWLVPILSLLSVGVFAFGDVEDTLRGYLNNRRHKKYAPSANESWVDTSDLPCRAKYPVIISKSGWENPISADSFPTAPPPPPPVSVIKIDTKQALAHTPSPPSSASSIEDEEFEKATFKYLQSPTAQSILRIPSPPPPAVQKRESDTVSNASSILSQSFWPIPPLSPVDGLPPRRGASAAQNGNAAFKSPFSPSSKSARHESADTLESMRFASPPPVPLLLTSSALAPADHDSMADGLAFSEVNAVPILSVPVMPRVVRKDSRRGMGMGLGPGAHRSALKQKRSDGAIYLTVVKETSV